MQAWEKIFRNKPKVVDENGCWLWQGRTEKGRGYTPDPRKANGHAPAAVVSYLVYVGDIPEGSHVHHKCKNKLCFNPEHLQTLTPAQHTLVHHPHLADTGPYESKRPQG